MSEIFVAKINRFPDSERRTVSHVGGEIGFFHWQGEIYAYENLCMHQGRPACEGAPCSIRRSTTPRPATAWYRSSAAKKRLRFMITAARRRPIHHNSFMKTYALLEEMGLPLGFHAGYNWNKRSMEMMTNKFISVHAIGFVFYNMVHLTDWIMNGLSERFPKLKVLWIESGLTWMPFMMQRLDNESMIRSSEAPALKKNPSDYMRETYFSTQPMEITDMVALKQTFRMIKAETQLLYTSDYPHWDFDPPSTVYDLPFLGEQTKRNILGGNAIKVFNLKLPAQ